ncbi:methionyl-tRNA formyltransferase [Embleya sp. NPDC050154]|uniref:methionyl-tRNA formyltransferase n=1 Tax=Embleya sp. NPDC050154 TaxID=3363988 RepID=UPI0037A2CEB8
MRARSLRPRRAADPHTPAEVAEIVERLPTDVDLALPRDGAGLTRLLAGADLDLILVHGFPWRVPASALRLPRLGAINIHSSLLPRHRGPCPIHWAIRAGDATTGVTIHRMTEDFDTGPVLARAGGIELADDIDPDALFAEIDATIERLLPEALALVAARVPGTPQDDTAATTAGWVPEEDRLVDWSRPARDIHNDVRMFHFFVDRAAIATVAGRRLLVHRTSPTPVSGAVRVECGDGPLWIVESEEIAT